MKFFRIEGKEVFLHNNKLYVEQEPLPYEYQDAIKDRVSHCSNCGKNGHLITGCPALRQTTMPSIRSLRERSELPNGGRKCSRCGKGGHRADRGCPEEGTSPRDEVGGDDGPLAGQAVDMRTRVQELKAQGNNSVQVARELGISLAEVNRHW